MLRRLRPFLPFILFSLLIFSTIDIARTLEKWLTGRFGQNVFNAVYILVGGALGIAFWRILKSTRREGWRIAGLLLLAALYVPLLVHLKFAVEKIHYVEYGLLALFAARPLARHYPLLPALFLSLCAVYGVGLLDEYIQHVHPDRVGEWRDAGINLTAGALALCGFAILSAGKKSPSATPAALPVWAALLATAATWVFLEEVHGFGHRLSVTPTVAFRSGLDSSTLHDINGRLSRNEAVDKKQSGIYWDEARRHCFQRDYYAGDWKSFNENLVLESAYGYFLTRDTATWNPPMRLKAAQNAAPLMETPWQSRVNERMIFQIKAGWARAAFMAALLALALAGFISRKKTAAA